MYSLRWGQWRRTECNKRNRIDIRNICLKGASICESCRSIERLIKWWDWNWHMSISQCTSASSELRTDPMARYTLLCCWNLSELFRLNYSVSRSSQPFAICFNSDYKQALTNHFTNLKYPGIRHMRPYQILYPTTKENITNTTISPPSQTAPQYTWGQISLWSTIFCLQWTVCPSVTVLASIASMNSLVS